MGRRNRRDDPRGRSPDMTEASAVTDPLTSVDDLLRETNNKLDVLITAVEQEGAGIVPDTPEVGDAARGGRFPAQDAPPVYPYDYSQVVPQQTLASDYNSDTFTAPDDGVIRRVVLGWPAGTQQAVGIGLRDADNSALIPRGPADANYLAYDDQVLSFNVNANVQDDDEVEIRFVNNDTSDHFVNVEIFFQEVNDAD